MKNFKYYLLIWLSISIGLSKGQRYQPEYNIQKNFKRCDTGTFVRGQTNSKDLWPKIYSLNSLAGGKDVYESYDSGYMVLGLLVDDDMINRMSIVMKTDVNGNPIWKRYIGDINNQGAFIHFTPTQDGGCILIGSTTAIDQCSDYFCYDVWIMKLDACGNKDWCKIYSVPMDIDDGADIVQLNNGNFIALINYFGTDIAEERIWLFCLSPDGETLWQKVYLTSEHPQWATNGYGFTLLKDKEENLLFTGDCVLYDNYISPTKWKFQLLNIKFSPQGEDLWGKPWYSEFDSSRRAGLNVALDYSGNYTIGGYAPYYPCQCHPPALLKVSKEGVNLQEIIYPQGIPMYFGAGGNQPGLAYISADSIVIGTQYWDESGWVPGHNVARLSDTLGNLLKEKNLFDDINELMRVQLTSDKHVLMTAGFWATTDSIKMFLYKLTPDLEYPPLDTRPLVYDYLCPETPQPIDTIFLDCDILVGLEEPIHQSERYSLLASPNPTSGQVTITIPDRMMKEWENNGISSRTLYYTLPDNLQLQFTDALGRMCETIQIAKKTQQVTINVSQWPAGIYLARLIGGNTVVADVKVMVK